MEKVFVMPKQGYQVRDPLTRNPLPPEGAEVTLSSYWKRRINDGDVTVSDKPKSKLKVVKNEKDSDKK